MTYPASTFPSPYALAHYTPAINGHTIFCASVPLYVPFCLLRMPYLSTNLSSKISPLWSFTCVAFSCTSIEICICLTLSNSVSAAAAANSLQLCPTLCDPIDSSPPGSPVPGILQARTLEWVAISFSNAGEWKVKVKSLSHVRLFGTPWTAADQAPLPMGFSRQECWSGVPSPSPIALMYCN